VVEKRRIKRKREREGKLQDRKGSRGWERNPEKKKRKLHERKEGETV